ncbi:beta strand repeat-containing protein, partial [Pontibacter sp. HJ8]
MPGQAGHEYKLISTAAFNPMPDASVTMGCAAILNAPASFLAGTVTWTDKSNQGYERFLSDRYATNPTVTPDATAPAYVDYIVSGNSNASECTNIPYSDEVRVYFYPEPVVTVGPNPAIICPGGSGVLLTGNVTGGDQAAGFDYFWYGPGGSVVSNTISYTATSIGTYKFAAVPKNSFNCKEFSATVNVVNNLTANAGPDQLVCAQGTAQLAGTVTAATGGIWSGGSGTFSNNTALNAIYTPSAADINAGSVRLTLTSTGNGSCNPVKDDVLITFYSMNVNLTGTPVICNGTLGTITANVTGGQGTVRYRWSSGETTATISNKPAGTYTVTVNDGKGCAVVKSFTVTEVTGPSDFAASTKNPTCGASNGTVTVGVVTGGTAPYSYSKDGTTYQTTTSFANLAPGAYSIRVKDANGCIVSKSFTLTDIPGPTAVAASALPASCADNDGTITAGAVTGGTAGYTYSINGTTFQAGTTFSGLASGTYTLTAKDANGCIITTSVTVTKVMPTDFTATAAASTCGNPNGTITVGTVAGGTAPYTYSRNGGTYQTDNSFTGLASGTHLIRVKDARNCIVEKQVVVTNIAGPTNLTATLKSSTCGNPNGEITVAAVGGTSGYSYSKDGVNFQPSGTFTGLAAGSHTFTVKDAKGCTFTKAFTLTNIAGPTAVAASTLPASCADNDGTITAGAVTGGTAGYTYSINGTTFQAGTTFSGLASGTYTLTAKDANGCIITTSVTVTKVMPTDFTATPAASTCGNPNGTVTVSNVVGGTAPYSYSKNGTTFQTSATLTGFAAGPHTITVKDARGCTFAKQVTVTNIAGPSDLAVTAASSTCGNPNGTITVGAVTGGTSTYTYSIDGTNYQTSKTFTALPAGDYQVRVKDANGCVYTKSVTIQNIAGPGLTVAAQSSTCGSSNGQITATVSGGTAPFRYSKDGTNFQDAAVFNNLAAGSYTITVRDANGCLQTASVGVTNIAGPTNLSLASTSSTCGASNGSIRVNGTTGGTASYTYSLDGTNFQSATTFGSLPAREYTVTVKDANGCTFSKKITVSNIAGPTDLTATVKASTCGATNGQFTISAVTGGTSAYIYSIDNTNFQTSSTFSALNAGTYQVTVKDANGCTYTEAVVVPDIAGPSNFTVAAQTTSCGRNNGSIRVTAVTGGTASYTYSKDGTNFQTSDTFAALIAGTYTITVKDANGCIFAKTVVLDDVAGPTDFALTTKSSTCGNPNGTITVGAVTGGTASYTYSRNGTTFQNSSTFTALAAGTYTITVKDANGCTFAKQIELTNTPGPTDFAANATSTTCGASNGELTITGVTGGTSGYTYSKDGVNFQNLATFTGLAAGAHTITVKDANGCTFAKAFTITNIAGPTAVAATTQAASCANNDGSITVGAVTGGTASYTYSINGSTFQAGTLFSGLASGTYTVTAKDANGCIVTRSVTVSKNIPTTFASTTEASTCGAANGTITVGTVTGGFAPYTYSQDGVTFQTSTTLTGFLAGTHTITVKDAKGCVVSRQVTVTNIAGPSALVASATASTCGNPSGSLIITNVTGGTAPYTYSKDGANFQASATFTGLTAGDHTITVKDANGCVYAREFSVTDVAGPAFAATPQSTTCGNSNGLITVSSVIGGTAPFTYSIDAAPFQNSNTFTALAAGTYSISVKDANGCVATQSVEVTDIAGPTGLTLASTSSTCGSRNGTITVNAVTGGTAPYTYSLNGTTFQSGATFGAVLAGTYTITVKDANGCIFTKEVTVDNIAGPTDLAATT